MFAVTKSIVDMHHGRVFVQSEGLGKGCTFIVDIPIAICVAVEDDDVEAKSSREVISTPTVLDREIRLSLKEEVADKHTRVLVVDDSDMNRKMIYRSLIARYPMLDEAVDGKDALEKVRTSLAESAYDVVLMDFQMPVMDGESSVDWNSTAFM